MFRSWELELETSSAPLQLHPELLRSYNFFLIEERAGLSWQNGQLQLQLRSSSAPAPLQLRSSSAPPELLILKNFRYCRVHGHWFPYSVRFSLFSQWKRCWTSVIFLTIFLLATLFLVARTLSESAHKMGICYLSSVAIWPFKSSVFLRVFIQSSISTYSPDWELLDYFFSESKSEW